MTAARYEWCYEKWRMWAGINKVGDSNFPVTKTCLEVHTIALVLEYATVPQSKRKFLSPTSMVTWKNYLVTNRKTGILDPAEAITFLFLVDDIIHVTFSSLQSVVINRFHE